VVTGYTVDYDGTAHTSTATSDGNVGTFTLTATTHTDAGDYPTDAWSFDGGTNYLSDSGTVHDHINKISAHPVVTGYTVDYDGTAHTATGTSDGNVGTFTLTATTHRDRALRKSGSILVYVVLAPAAGIMFGRSQFIYVCHDAIASICQDLRTVQRAKNCWVVFFRLTPVRRDSEKAVHADPDYLSRVWPCPQGKGIRAWTRRRSVVRGTQSKDSGG